MNRQGDLVHLWRCRRRAIDQLLANSRPPAEPHSFRQAHELYLLYLHSLLDLADAMEEGGVLERWREALDGLGGKDGRHNATYLRELRNSAVKRGADVTGAGQVADGQICALAAEVSDRNGERSYQPFDPWLRNLFHHCELALAPSIAPLVLRLIAEAERMPGEALSRLFRLGVAATDHMPAEVKIEALRYLSGADLTEIRSHHLGQLRQMLDGQPPAGLKVTAPYVPGR